MAPTLLKIAGVPPRDDFDGLAIPLTKKDMARAEESRHEHVSVEHWGFASNEGKMFEGFQKMYFNNTYKALRVISDSYNLHYQVWCNNDHELYDLSTDPGQMNNLLEPEEEEEGDGAKESKKLLGFPLEDVASRLDSLLFVLKSCKADTCIHPWHALHPGGNVDTLRDALSSRFDHFYAEHRQKIRFKRCEMGYILDAEGPQFGQDMLPEFEFDAKNWHEWT